MYNAHIQDCVVTDEHDHTARDTWRYSAGYPCCTTSCFHNHTIHLIYYIISPYMELLLSNWHTSHAAAVVEIGQKLIGNFFEDQTFGWILVSECYNWLENGQWPAAISSIAAAHCIVVTDSKHC